MEYFGEMLFRSDLCNADVAMGNLLIHEGAPCIAQQHAAKVFNADKTYFVLNGTSSSNKVVLNALLTPGNWCCLTAITINLTTTVRCYRLARHRFIWKPHVTRMALSVALMRTVLKKVTCVS